MEPQFFCMCGARFVLSSSFTKHQRSDCSVLLGNNLHQCENCGVKFSKKRNLIRHQKSSCKSEKNFEKKFYTCTYPDCTFRFYKLTSLTDHVEYFHHVKIESEKLTFKNYEEFFKWKQKEEQSTFSYFAKRHSAPTNTTYETYYCQFHGSDKPHHSNKGTKKNLKGRSKTGMICYAHIFTKINPDKSVTVKYVSSHTHPLTADNTKFQPLSQNLKDDILRMHSICLSPPEIYRRVTRTGISRENRDDPKPGREIFIKMHNIKYILKTAEQKWDLSAAETTEIENIVERWKCEKYNPVVLYKPRGCLSNDICVPAEYFILGFQTKEQRDMMKMGSQDMLFIDLLYDTHGFGVQMLTAVVADQNQQEYPVAHFITSCTDEKTLTICLRALRNNLPSLKINSVMTSDSRFFKIVKNVFNEDINCYLCHNFVLNQWRKKLRESNQPEEIEENIISVLKGILNEKCEDKVKSLGRRFCFKYLQSAPAFVRFFDSFYLKDENIPFWSSAFRHGEFNTNSLIDTFHEVLKERYLKRISRFGDSKLDKLLIILSEIEKDYYAKHLDEHQIELSDDDEGILMVDSNVWQIGCRNKLKSFTVTRIMDVCDQNDCHQDNCSHLYSCNCNGLICRHIEKVHERILLLSNSNLGNEETVPEKVKSIAGSLSELSTLKDDKHVQESGLDRLDSCLKELVKEYTSIRDNAQSQCGFLPDLCLDDSIMLHENTKEFFTGNPEYQTMATDDRDRGESQLQDHLYCIPQVTSAEDDLQIGSEIVVSEELEDYSTEF